MSNENKEVEGEGTATPQECTDLSAEETPTDDFQEHLRSILGSDSESDDAKDHSETFQSNSRISDFPSVSYGLEKGGTNKSFTPYQLSEIERTNSMLMNRILSYKTRKNQFPVTTTTNTIVSSHFINRKKKEKEIDQHNLILLKRIKSIKSFGLSQRKK